MLNDTWFQYLIIRACILGFQAIAPVCSLYTLLQLQGGYTAIKAGRPLPTIGPLEVYCAAEAAFYLFFLWYSVHLQREAIHPPLRSKEERKKLFDKVRSEIHDPARFLSGWFRGAKMEDIGRDDLKDFLSWTFWEGRTTSEDEKELEEVTQNVERMMNHKFRPGKSKKGVKTLRLTIDPIDMTSRSLFWYAIILGVDTTSHVRMLRYGFQYYATPTTSWAVFPPRPLAAATATGKSKAAKVSYWVRRHTSKKRLPIIFIHGIGVGLHPYIEFLHKLDIALNSDPKSHGDDADGHVGILCVETLPISTRLTHAILTRPQFLAQMTQILEAEGYDRFVLLSHSYGSVHSTHLMTDPVLSKRIAAALLVDPVTILLHMPDVAYNFTVRQPTHANEWQLCYFASKDPGVAHTLGRHFFWSENVLWRDHITYLIKEQGMKITASLARRDLIVDTPAVAAYLMEYEVPDPVVIKGQRNGNHMELLNGAKKKVKATNGTANGKLKGKMVQGGKWDVGGPEGMVSEKQEEEDWRTRQWKGEGLEVLWWNDFDHAQVFDQDWTKAKLIEVLVKYSLNE